MIEGEPLAQKRARFARVGAHVRTYDPMSEKKEVTKAIIRAQVRQRLKGSVCCVMEFFMPIPKSYTKKRREACIAMEELPAKKPDIDNFVKYYFDCMNDIAFDDDSQVCALEAYKYFSETPRVEIKLI